MNATLKDEEFKNTTKEPHQCFWCGELTYSPFWSCRECYPKKEAAYKKMREDGIKRNYFETINFVTEYVKTGV